MFRKKVLFGLSLLLISPFSFAGNKDRTGQAGAGELLLNPWGRSQGVFGLNGANVSGLEALKNNVAGLARLRGTEIGIAHTRYLAGYGMSTSNVGIAQGIGESGTFAVNMFVFGFGEIPRTTVNAPDLGIGTYKPQFFNATLGYSKLFSNSISAGLSATYVNEALSDIRANAIGFDAGIQYQSGERDNLHIGINLRNVGTNLRFSGDGFSFNGLSPEQAKDITVTHRSDKYGLPTQLNLAFAYDFYLDAGNQKLDAEGNPTGEVLDPKHKLTTMLSFISNSYFKNWGGVGLEYSYNNAFYLRLAYRYEDGIMNADQATTFYTGLAGGIGFMAKVSKTNRIAIDYAYQQTRIANGMHGVTLRFFLDKEKEIED